MSTKRSGLVPRRSLLLAAPAVLSLPLKALAAVEPTPSQTAGPFYPKTIPEDRDADLVRFNGRDFGGEVIEMAGQVFDLARAPVPGAVVEIWHCDPAGIYPNVGPNNGGLADPGFQGFGAVRTAADGGYMFRTIRPGVYPGRVRHIHVKVRTEGRPTLTTQMYFPEEQDNADDFLLRRVSNGAALIAERIDGPQVRYRFDVFLG